MRGKRKGPVPDVLWRLFGDRARTLSDTIVSLLPPSPPYPELCHCKGRRCLGCSSDARSFLLRPDDPSHYRKLLAKCYVVVSENAPSIRFFDPHSHCPQNQIVTSIIELVLDRSEPAYSNVLCSGYDRNKCSSPIVELLSGASWCLLLSRVGDDFMVYLLRNTSIFLPAPHGKHHQVGGPPISPLCFDMLKNLSKFNYQHPSLHKCGAQKRKRTDGDDANGPVGFASNLGLTDKSSMQLIRHHESRNYDVSVSEAPKSTRTGSVISKSESKGKPDLDCITTRLRKRSRPFSWQRRRLKKQKQLIFEENSLNTHCNLLPTNTDCLDASLQHENTSLSYRVKMLWQCPCCLILRSLPTVPKRTDIKRQSIFYNLESSLSVLPKKLLSKRNVPTAVVHVSLTLHACQGRNEKEKGYRSDISLNMYHSLLKWFKHLIRRTQCCQHAKFLDKHCVAPSLDQHKIGRSSSRLKDNVSGTKAHEKSQEIGTKHETINSQCEAVKSFCSKSQVVSFIWAVSRSLLPPELLGTPSNWRIMRRNISKFIHLRRFEKFHLKLCMHELKTSRFPFLSNGYFLSSQHGQVLKHIEAHDNVLHKEFINWNNAVHDVKRKLLEKWIFWYFSHLVVPLVQSNFYVTESEQGKQGIYYYRKPVWEKLTMSTIACFKDWKYSHLDDVAVHNILRGRPFGFSKLRLQPKENGVRMVANLKSSSRMPLSVSTMGVRYCKTERKAKHQKIKFEHYRSVNSVLRDAHAILKGIQLKEPQKLGSSVFDYNDVYKKLCPFLVGQKKGSASLSDFFIVTSDVLKAFDSVDQDKLLDIMKDVLVKDDYLLKQYDQVVCTKKSFWVQKHFALLDETSNTDHTRFTSFASFRSQHSVFVNQERWKRVKNQALFSNLTEHVKRNVLQFDGKFYLQGVGIPQGGVLSSLLCSLYYGHLDKHVIFPFLEKTLESGSCKENNAVHTSSDDKVSSPCYMLMRFIDDFLFISTSKKQAASFFSRLQRGFRGYNCYMNEKKFGANFDVEQITGSPLNRVYAGKNGDTSFVRWSGLLINCSTMEIQADYTRYLSNHLSSTLTVCWQGIQPILKLEKEEVEWLGFHAYLKVLKRKESRHKELLAILRSKLLSHRMSQSVSPELKYAVDANNSSLLWNIKY
ncbi:Telomerase reverse transcriptase [Sesbania bispinosa]|nr:Telomerase reverse transcriptase [Sesbania bispinosa]